MVQRHHTICSCTICPGVLLRLRLAEALINATPSFPPTNYFHVTLESDKPLGGISIILMLHLPRILCHTHTLIRKYRLNQNCMHSGVDGDMFVKSPVAAPSPVSRPCCFCLSGWAAGVHLQRAGQRAEADGRGRKYCKAPRQRRIAHIGSWGVRIGKIRGTKKPCQLKLSAWSAWANKGRLATTIQASEQTRVDKGLGSVIWYANHLSIMSISTIIIKLQTDKSVNELSRTNRQTIDFKLRGLTLRTE